MNPCIDCLLAEDEPATRLLLTALLEHAGYRVHAVADGTAAWAALAEAPPPLAIIDWQMPGLDGREVVRRLRAGGGRTWVLMLSGRAGGAQEALEAGADAFMAKPPDLDALLAALAAGAASRA